MSDIRRSSIVASLFLCGCSTVQEPTVTLPARVQTIAVLLPDGETFGMRARHVLARMLAGVVRERGFATRTVDFVEDRLTRAGYEPWRPDWFPSGAELPALAELLDVDAVLTCRNVRGTHLQSGIFFDQYLGAHLTLFDREGAMLWRSDETVRQSGGVLLESGQVLDALRSTVDSEARRTLWDLMTRFVLEGMETFPTNHNPSSAPTPIIASFEQVDAAPVVETRSLDGHWVFELRGTPQGSADVQIEGIEVRHPLSEVEPGLYRGALVRFAGMPAELRCIGNLRGSLGATAEPFVLEPPIVVGLRLEAPAEASVEVVDVEQRSVRLSWAPVDGAVAYVVYRTRLGSTERVEVGNVTSFEERVPEGEAAIQYYVAGLDDAATLGRFGQALSVRFVP